jgi:hypothetical protein
MNRTYAPPVYRGLEGEIVKETEKAILFRAINKRTGEEVKQAWFPKSQLASFGGRYDEVDGTFNYILASEWILGQNALLSVSVARDLIKIVPKAQAVNKPVFTGTTKQDKANRGDLKNDEGQPAWEKGEAPDDYFNQQFGTGEDE